MSIDVPGRTYGPWTKWDGGFCPFKNIRDSVTIRNRRGHEFDTDCPASWAGWNHRGEGDDIVAYRKIT